MIATAPTLPLLPADQAALARAKQLLEHPGLAIQLINVAGMPVEYLLRNRFSAKTQRRIDAIVHKTLDASCKVALKTLPANPKSLRPRNGWHRVGVAATGAAGGFFGALGASVELPITTTAILRSILEIAHSHGAPMDAPETRVACLEVLALGGSSKTDDAADTGYFAVRAALAQQISAAVNHLASKGLADRGAPAMLSLISRIAAYFTIPVSEKLAAQAIPVIGAVSGSTLNLIFISHFQRMAEGHFCMLQLERRYGKAAVEAAYRAI